MDKKQSLLGLAAGVAITGGFIYGLFWVASKGWNAGK
jgi:hypothetical protein